MRALLYGLCRLYSILVAVRSDFEIVQYTFRVLEDGTEQVFVALPFTITVLYNRQIRTCVYPIHMHTWMEALNADSSTFCNVSTPLLHECHFKGRFSHIGGPDLISSQLLH